MGLRGMQDLPNLNLLLPLLQDPAQLISSERGAESEVAHKWAGGYITPAAWGVPTASERGAESEVAQKWARWLHNPCRLAPPTASQRGAESEVAS